jgi:hypothetical protein
MRNVVTKHQDTAVADLSAALTPSEAAAFLAVNPKTLANWRVSGKGPDFLKYGRRMVRYRLADLVAWRDARIHTSTSDFA